MIRAVGLARRSAVFVIAALVATLAIAPSVDAQISFSKRTLAVTSNLNAPTSLQFGPDGRLYVAQQDGTIRAYNISRNSQGNYSVTATEVINQVKNIQNHDDDGVVNSGINNRLCTGLLVTGTAQTPVLYVTSADPRIGGGADGTDKNLDTNSGIVSRLTKNGSSWTKLDIVRGLPRSEENHTGNGMALDLDGDKLYVAQGGNTNQGAPSINFAQLPEYALSAAILEIDLEVIGDSTYNLPTLNDEDRSGSSDANDPFGGNNGKNQARLVPGGPVQIYAPGFRNPYDVMVTEAGRMYTIDNGPNGGWGDVPVGEGGSNCTNGISEPGVSHWDNLHHIPSRGYYAGHPNPTRARTANTFNSSNPQSPVSSNNTVECDYRAPGAGDGALFTFKRSTNGLVEYTASNFGDAMEGDLLATSFDNQIWRIQLNGAGTAVASATPLFASVGSEPLDVTTQGDNAVFPGTVWVAEHALDSIIVYEPADLDTCTGADNASLDEDDDGFDNADEIDNGTNPCSAGDTPPDIDGDFWSDLNDIDDDNDGTPDTDDPFAIDADDGTETEIPLLYGWENDDPFIGGLLGLGFTGLITNGDDDYVDLFDADEMTAGGAAGVVTVERASEGDARGNLNTQSNGFQVGFPVPTDSDEVSVHTSVVAPFLGIEPEPEQSLGLFVGNGDQDNYFKIVASAGTGEGAIETLLEVDGEVTVGASDVVFFPGPASVELFIVIDRVEQTVQGGYALANDGVRGPIFPLGEPIDIPGAWLTDSDQGLAAGIISTSRGAAPSFAATWDRLEVSIGRAFCTDPVECDVDGDGLVGDADPCVFEARNLCFGPPALDRTSSKPIRLNANVSSAECSGEKTDCNGDVWQADFGYNQAGNSSICNLGGGGEGCVISGIAEIFGCEDEPTEDIFQCSHTDPAGAPELVYDFNVPDGEYVVNLYFANTFNGTTAPGSRLFDIEVEGAIAYADFDQVAAAGGSGRAVVRTAVADVSDGNGLQIEFVHGLENPTLKAIEVLRDITVTTTTSTTTITSTTSTSTTTTSTTLPASLCGDGNGDGRIAAVDALVVLRTAVGLGQCDECVCDVDESGVVGATDALAVLSASVGSPVALDCIPCP